MRCQPAMGRGIVLVAFMESLGLIALRDGTDLTIYFNCFQIVSQQDL